MASPTKVSAAHEFLSSLFSGVLSDTRKTVQEVGAVEDASRPWVNPPRTRARDAIQRTAALAGFTKPRYDPEAAGRTLAEIAALADGLAETWNLLADRHSRDLLMAVLRFRALGPHHAALPITSREFWTRCERFDEEHRERTGVAQSQWGLPLHLYKLEGRTGPVRLIGHPLQAIEFFELRQYAYEHDGVGVAPEPGDVVVEAGGGWGDTALWLADEVGPDGRVFSFEFVTENLELMYRNLDENERLRELVEVVPSPLWSSAGEELSFTPSGPMTAIGSDGSEQRTSASIDELRETRGLGRVDFIKLDVEGVELDALKGAERTLRECRPRLAVAVYHRIEDFVEIPHYLAGLGYELYFGHSSAGAQESVVFGRP